MQQEKANLIMYQTEDGLTKIEVTFEGDTVWLTQEQMAQLFQRERSVITKHIKNVFDEGELDEKSNVQNLHIANSDKTVKFYSLNTIISVGYRVKSLRGTQFRIWATSILKALIMTHMPKLRRLSLQPYKISRKKGAITFVLVTHLCVLQKNDFSVICADSLLVIF